MHEQTSAQEKQGLLEKVKLYTGHFFKTNLKYPSLCTSSLTDDGGFWLSTVQLLLLSLTFVALQELKRMASDLSTLVTALCSSGYSDLPPTACQQKEKIQQQYLSAATKSEQNACFRETKNAHPPSESKTHLCGPQMDGICRLCQIEPQNELLIPIMRMKKPDLFQGNNLLRAASFPPFKRPNLLARHCSTDKGCLSVDSELHRIDTDCKVPVTTKKMSLFIILCSTGIHFKLQVIALQSGIVLRMHESNSFLCTFLQQQHIRQGFLELQEQT